MVKRPSSKFNGIDPDKIQRVYVRFREGLSVEEGRKLLESSVLAGESLNVSRIDEKGNALVVKVPGKYVKLMDSLEEVTFIKVETPARPTVKRASLQ